jgi:hypothetical protein
MSDSAKWINFGIPKEDVLNLFNGNSALVRSNEGQDVKIVHIADHRPPYFSKQIIPVFSTLGPGEVTLEIGDSIIKASGYLWSNDHGETYYGSLKFFEP